MAANPIISDSVYLNLNSHEFEASLIGAVLTVNWSGESGRVADRAIKQVPAESFYNPHHRRIWQAIQDVHQSGGSPDLVSVNEALKRAEVLDEIGGTALLVQIASVKPIWTNIPLWSGAIREYAMARDLARGLKSAFSAESPTALVERVRNAVESIRSVDDKRGRPVSLGELGVAEADRLDEEAQQVRFPTIRTGLRLLDRTITGWRPATLNIIAAGTSVGKSSAALTAMLGQAKQGMKTVLYAFEMSPSACYWRLVSMVSRVSGRRIRAGELDGEQFARIKRAQEEIHEYRDLMRFVDAGGLNISDLKMGLCREAEEGADCLYVDHAGLIVADGKSRYEQTSLIADELRGLKSRFDAPLIVLMQINRLAKTERREPQLHDLRDSGKWEENADTISLLHRPTASESLEPGQSYEPLWWHIAKEREGPTGKIEFAYLRNYALISEGV